IDMRLTKTQTALFTALLAGNAVVLFAPLPWNGLRYPAAFLLTFILPGWAWLAAFDWLDTRQAIERAVLIPGLSSLLSAVALLLALLTPGPFTETPVLVALNLVTLAGLAVQFVRRTADDGLALQWPSRRVLLILLAILAVAAVTRLTRLGYAEFHEDELENMRLIVRAYKGEEYAPFLDSKGPIHWLLPAAMWFLHGWVNEAVARTPVALTSLLLIPAIYALGRRMSNRDSIGLLAAGFVAVNGFFVAYARHVENQSLIVFWGVLAMWLAYRFYREQADHLLPWVGLALAVGLIAHPDVLLYLPVFGWFIGLVVWQSRDERPQLRRWLVLAAALFAGLTALFYIPYINDPNIRLVMQYFESDRVGASLLYNRMPNLFDQDKLYSTRYHAPLLVALLLWLTGRHLAGWSRRGPVILAVLAGWMAATLAWPDAWAVGRWNIAFIPYALLTLLVVFLPGPGLEVKVLYLWLMVPIGALEFLAKDAADHIQIAYPAWALLAAIALRDLWAWLNHQPDLLAPRLMPRPARQVNLTPALATGLKTGLVLLLTAVAGLILAYQYLTFDATVWTYWQAKRDAETNPRSIYTRLYGGIQRPRKIFSNPRLGGWKVVGYLWETGVLHGDFRSINESFAVPIWYTFQTPRSCYEDPQNYWVRRDWDEWPDEEQKVVEAGYTLTRVVLVDGQPKLHLYEKDAPARQPEMLNLPDFIRPFDLLATPARFARPDPIATPTAFSFGDRLLLRGYTLPTATAHPGDRIPLTVYWEALSPMEVRYRGFVHLVGPDGTLRGQHDDDPACRLLTTDMRPGQQSSRQFRLPVAGDAPPGEYTIVFGLYHPDTLERLPITDQTTGQTIGDSLILGQVRIE
ncbi:MAG: phospholipid carrier-dependent glycosyltransferase, partial [Chloroflexi bacterium]